MASGSKYKKLLEPYHIGPVKTRNRIIKSGASMMSWHENELHMNETTLAFYEAVARGGAGLVVVESPTIDYPVGARWEPRYRLDDDKYIPGMSELVSVIHRQGCPTFMQMEHDGPWQSPLFGNAPATFEGPPVGASAINLNVPGDFHRDVPRPLTIPEIQEIVNKYASAAVRAKQAGFDGIDINAGSSHLLHNFLSPFWNRRQDEYGGSAEKRARLLLEIVREIKKRAGKDFPVSVCINGIEVGQAIGIKNSDCFTAGESRAVARMLQEAGTDAIMVRNHWLGYHTCGFLPDYLFFPEAPVPQKEFPVEYYWRKLGAAANLYLAEGLKKTVSIPIIIIGKISPELGEKILREGKADFIGMHRALMADPELPNKIAVGRIEDIAPCTACGTCLDQSVTMLRHCRINAAMGTPYYIIEKADRKKKVVVVGGGPAGLEAARVAALRGHDVTLYEKTSRLGGLLPLATLIKGLELENIPDLVRYLQVQIKKLGVKVKLNAEFGTAEAETVKPDVVIVAAGGILAVPEIAGLSNPKVLTAPALHRRVKPYLWLFGPRLLGWLTRFWLPVGKNVVIIGGGLHGCEIAEFLVKRGRKVTIIEKDSQIGAEVIDFRLGLTLGWFERKGVAVITGVKKMEVTGKGLSIVDREDKKQLIVADTIIPTRPLVPNLELFDSLAGKVPEIYAVGDCREPRKIINAIADAYETVRKL
jgi:2,4-dienoyl-CoA reductase (NADPH2)